MDIRPVLLSLTMVIAVPGSAVAATTHPSLDTQEQSIYRQVNTYRARHGRPALRVSVALTRAATWMSRDMAADDYVDHTDSRGRSFSRRLSSFGYKRARRKAENIAAGESTATATFEPWRESSGHRRNMLSRRYKVIGIARAYNADSTFGWYWTLDSAAPAIAVRCAAESWCVGFVTRPIVRRSPCAAPTTRLAAVWPPTAASSGPSCETPPRRA